MKTGIYYWFGYPIELNERFKLINEAGFDNVLLWWGDEFEEFIGPKEYVPEMARKHNLYVENAHLPYEKANLLWQDNADANALTEKYIEYIAGCGQCGIPCAVLHITGGNTPPSPNSYGVENLKKICGAAEDSSVIIALENLRRPDYLHYVFSRIESDNLMFCYDSGHDNCHKTDVDLVSLYGHKLAALHLHDNNGIQDQHLLPGEGIIDWDALALKIKAAGYTGAASLESVCLKNKKLSAIDYLKMAYSISKEFSEKMR